jgi:hypothetical protein
MEIIGTPAMFEKSKIKYISKLMILIGLLLIFSTSCSTLLSTYVRFENRSATKTVEAIWDGIRSAVLTPGEISEYKEVNPGTHTIKWQNASNSKTLTTLGYPNLVEGKSYTFPYNDE